MLEQREDAVVLDDDRVEGAVTGRGKTAPVCECSISVSKAISVPMTSFGSGTASRNFLNITTARR